MLPGRGPDVFGPVLFGPPGLGPDVLTGPRFRVPYTLPPNTGRVVRFSPNLVPLLPDLAAWAS